MPRSQPLKRRKIKSQNSEIIAYDFETTNIKEGTPKPIYITAFGNNTKISKEVSDKTLLKVLEKNFLTKENVNCRFVAWNGNKYDSYFIAKALIKSDKWMIRPYLAKGGQLRGLRVQHCENLKLQYEFLDGMAMTGLLCNLKTFLEKFAPKYAKLDLDFEKEEFNPKNKKHVEYAMRDSEGLFYAMQKANEIIKELTGGELTATIGNLGIKNFRAHMPEKVLAWPPNKRIVEKIRSQGFRGGFCYCAKKYSGKIWKYDINQAYAHAMRSAELPAGRVFETGQFHPDKSGFYLCEAKAPREYKIPFYYKTDQGPVFSKKHVEKTWLTSIEIKQLETEGFKIKIYEGYYWNESFNMKELVDKLEALRKTDPKGPLGTMVKSLGNNAYGKTVERIDDTEYILAKECPEGFRNLDPFDTTKENIFYKINEKNQIKDYHCPQIGMFITAFVRMQLRQVALTNEKNWVYADTDCLAFKTPTEMEICSTTYGKWKQENDGDMFWFITKKVYASHDGSEMHCKGLNLAYLTTEDFKKWFNGTPPTQKQLQRMSFMKVMQGFDMFKEREKVGQIL